jgi:ornithine cyclodeaminase
MDLSDFLGELATEIERTYSDPRLESIERTGWTRTPDTLELMGCQSTDFTCIKLISSNPSLAGPSIATVTGTLICTDIKSDEARLVCDAAILTSLRTAASTAVAVRLIAPNIETVAIVGAGLEGTCHAVVLAILLPTIRQIRFSDVEKKQTNRAIRQAKAILAQESVLDDREIDIGDAGGGQPGNISDADLVVTATFGTTEAVTDPKSLQPGAVVAAVGADLQGKRELGYRIYDEARFVADDLWQCLHEGELQEAQRRLRVDMPKKSHKGTLQGGRILGVADLIEDASDFVNRKENITVYDSTGFSGQDLAVARVVLRHLESDHQKPTVWNPPSAASLTDLLGRTGG